MRLLDLSILSDVVVSAASCGYLGISPLDLKFMYDINRIDVGSGGVNKDDEGETGREEGIEGNLFEGVEKSVVFMGVCMT